MPEFEYFVTRRGLLLHTLSIAAATDLSRRKFDRGDQSVTHHIITNSENLTVENLKNEFGNPRDLVELGYIFLLAPLLNWGPVIITLIKCKLATKGE